jgi:hypothetical protein
MAKETNIKTPDPFRFMRFLTWINGDHAIGADLLIETSVDRFSSSFQR